MVEWKFSYRWPFLLALKCVLGDILDGFFKLCSLCVPLILCSKLKHHNIFAIC